MQPAEDRRPDPAVRRPPQRETAYRVQQRRTPRPDDFLGGYSSGPLASTLGPRGSYGLTEQRRRAKRVE